MFCNIGMLHSHLEDLLKTDCWAAAPEFLISEVCGSLRMCISIMFSSGTGIACLQPQLRGPTAKCNRYRCVDSWWWPQWWYCFIQGIFHWSGAWKETHSILFKKVEPKGIQEEEKNELDLASSWKNRKKASKRQMRSRNQKRCLSHNILFQ